MIDQKIEILKVEDLNLWTENPRDPIEVNATDFQIISRALNDNNKKWKLQTLINGMGQHYDFSELPTVVNIDGKYIVYDGNRRIAVLKYLQNEELYKKLNGGIFFSEEPKELRELTEIPCNLCNKETALKNVVRKHIGTGSWNELEKDYFQLTHLNKPKSHFVYLEEQTGIISSNPKLAQRFVKEEVLTIENLAEIGFHFKEGEGFVSNFDSEKTNAVLKAIVDLVDKEIISTRNNRKQLKEPLISNNPELKDIIKKYNPKEAENKLEIPIETKTVPLKKNPRKTPKSKPVEIIFGKTLSLKVGKVNDLYRAICNVYESNINDNTILPILGMSLRLITEVGARLYFEEKNPEFAKKDQLYNEFLKQAKKEMTLKQEEINLLSLTKEWLDGNDNLEGILAKYAHGNLPVNKDSIIKHSQIIGEILEYYFKK